MWQGDDVCQLLESKAIGLMAISRTDLLSRAKKSFHAGSVRAHGSVCMPGSNRVGTGYLIRVPGAACAPKSNDQSQVRGVGEVFSEASSTMHSRPPCFDLHGSSVGRLGASSSCANCLLAPPDSA